MRRNFGDVVELLISYGAKIANLSDNNFVEYIRRNNKDVMEVAVNKLDKKRINVLFMKLEYCPIEMVELFIEAGANVDKYGEQLYLKSKRCGNKHLAAHLKRMLN